MAPELSSMFTFVAQLLAIVITAIGFYGVSLIIRRHLAPKKRLKREYDVKIGSALVMATSLSAISNATAVYRSIVEKDILGLVGSLVFVAMMVTLLVLATRSLKKSIDRRDAKLAKKGASNPQYADDDDSWNPDLK